MRYPQPVLAASLVGLSLLAAVPARAQVAETVRVSLTEPEGGGGPVARRRSTPVLAVFALPVTAGIEASDHPFQKARGELLIPNANVFRVEKPLGTVAAESLTRALPFWNYEGERFGVEIDEASLLDGAPDRGGGTFWAR